MVGAALTPFLWAVVVMGYVVVVLFTGEEIQWYEWLIVSAYTVGSGAYLWKLLRAD